MPYYFLHTAENTYFIVFTITYKNEALLYEVEHIHTIGVSNSSAG